MCFFTLFCSSLFAAAGAAAAAAGTVWVTPHESYSSSVGVLGCKVDTNRIAYWPGSVDCNKICVSLSYGGRTVNLLRVDQSEGAYDISYDAWNYLFTGFSATEKPATGGPVAMEYKDVDPSACAALIHTEGGKLPLSASNSMNFLASCLAQDSWVGKNHVLYNILDPICSWGHDEVCSLDWPAANQASCPSGLGTPTALTTAPVYNIQYMTGQRILASTGKVVSSGGSRPAVTVLSLPAVTVPSLAAQTLETLGASQPSQPNGGRAAHGSVAWVLVAWLLTYWIRCNL